MSSRRWPAWLAMVTVAGVAALAVRLADHDDVEAQLTAATVPGTEALLDADAEARLADAAEAADEGFCDTYRSVDVDRPERYVGSPEHLADIDRLRTSAPVELQPAVQLYRDYLASGAIDPSDATSGETDHFPPDVHGAVIAIQEYAAAHCPS